MKKRVTQNTPLGRMDEIARIDRDGEFVFPPYTRHNRPETDAEAARSGRPIRLVGIYADNTRGDVLEVWRVNGEEKRTPMCVESAAMVAKLMLHPALWAAVCAVSGELLANPKAEAAIG